MTLNSRLRLSGHLGKSGVVAFNFAMKIAKLEPTVKRSRAAGLLDKTSRTLQRYEAQGLLTPIKLNCRAVVYPLAQVQRLLAGDFPTAPDRAAAPPCPRAKDGRFQPAKA